MLNDKTGFVLLYPQSKQKKPANSSSHYRKHYFGSNDKKSRIDFFSFRRHLLFRTRKKQTNSIERRFIKETQLIEENRIIEHLLNHYYDNELSNYAISESIQFINHQIPYWVI